MFPETHQLNANEVYGRAGINVGLVSYSLGYLLLKSRTCSTLKISSLLHLIVLSWLWALGQLQLERETGVELSEDLVTLDIYTNGSWWWCWLSFHLWLPMDPLCVFFILPGSLEEFWREHSQGEVVTASKPGDCRVLPGFCWLLGSPRVSHLL